MERVGYVYIMASRRNGTLYIGWTGDLARRAYEHRNGLLPGFTRDYGCVILVHYEVFGDPGGAVRRERQLKEWQRAWKIRLIEQDNPLWVDLYPRLA